MKPENFEEKSEKNFWQEKEKKKRSRKMGEKYPKITIQGKMQKKKSKEKNPRKYPDFFLWILALLFFAYF